MGEGITRREAILKALAVASLFVSKGVAKLFSEDPEVQPFLVRINERIVKLTPEEFVDPFLKGGQGERFFYYQLQFPTYVSNLADLDVITAVNRECEARERKVSGNVYQTARLRGLRAATAVSLLSRAKPEDVPTLKEVIVQTSRSALDPNEQPNRIVLEIVWQNMIAALIRNDDNWSRLRAGDGILGEAAALCLRFLEPDEATLPLMWPAVSAWQFLITYELALAERGDIDELRRVQGIRDLVRKTGSTRLAWFNELDVLYKGLKTREEMPPQAWENIVGRRWSTPGSKRQRIADFFAVLSLQGSFYNSLIEEGKLPAMYLNVAAAESTRKILRTYLPSYGVSQESWPRLKETSGRLLSQAALKYTEELFKQPLSPVDESQDEKAERRDAEFFSRLVPFRQLDEWTFAKIALGSKATRHAALERLSKAGNPEGRLALLLWAAKPGTNLRIPGGKGSVHDSTLEEEISQHRAFEHDDFRRRIAEGTEAARDELKQKTISAGFGAVETNRKTKPAEVPLPGQGEGDPVVGERSTLKQAKSEGRRFLQEGPLFTVISFPFFGRPFKRVRFLTEEGDKLGFRILRRSGYPVKFLRGGIYGLSSKKQIALLDEQEVPYQMVD